MGHFPAAMAVLDFANAVFQYCCDEMEPEFEDFKTTGTSA